MRKIIFDKNSAVIRFSADARNKKLLFITCRAHRVRYGIAQNAPRLEPGE